MAKRYYISRVVGSGTHEDPWNSELRQYIIDNWPNEPHFEQQIIHPNVLLWCIMKYDFSQAAHEDVMANVTGIHSFGNRALGMEMRDIPVETRNQWRTKLENMGFDFDWATLDTTLRQILKYLCRSMQLASWAQVLISNKNFDLNTTVANVPVAARNRIRTHMQNLGIPTDWITGSHTVGEVVQRVQRHNSDSSKRLFGTIKQKQWLFQDEDD